MKIMQVKFIIQIFYFYATAVRLGIALPLPLALPYKIIKSKFKSSLAEMYLQSIENSPRNFVSKSHQCMCMDAMVLYLCTEQ